MRILIADDSFLSRAILERMVRELGCEPVLAVDGEAAWAVAQRGDSPPILLLDWVMPGITGIGLCARIRARHRGTLPYIILLSAKGEKQHIVEGLDAGANDYLTKPYNEGELLARIRVGIRVVALQEELSARIAELEGARAEIHTLQRFLPVCMYCRKVSTDERIWSDLEQYMEEHEDIELSHVICPDCRAEHHPELLDEDE